MASTGFWQVVQFFLLKKSKQTKLLTGLAYDRIMYLGMSYINRGYIMRDEYESLHNYLWNPYKENGGNGSASRIMKEVEKLEIR